MANLAFAFVATVVIISYYAPFVNNFFIYDDFKYIENIFSGIISTLFGYNTIRFVGNISFLPLHFLSGFNPIGYNIFNLIIHFINSLMLYLLLNRLFKNSLLSFFAGIIFVASATASDAVLWKTANCNLLSLMFCLITFYLYVRWRQELRRPLFLWSLLTYTLAMFSKEDSASLPLLFLLAEILFWKGWKDKLSLFKRLTPYSVIVLFYIFTSLILINVFGIYLETFQRFFKIRLLYSLFGGYTVFFLHPDGFLSLASQSIYIALALISVSFLLVKERKLLWFGYGWIFISFLPSSLSGLGQFEPIYLFNSISRYLYTVSVGSAIVFSVILLSIKERFSQKVFMITSMSFFVVFILINYGRVNERGKKWQEGGILMKIFLSNFKNLQPSLSENSSVHIINSPIGRAYIQQSLRAFYGNPKIYWVDDPIKAAYTYLVVNDNLFNKHKSIMRMSKSIGTDDIGPVMKFYELKGWNNEKLELLDAISTSAFNDAKMHYRLAQIYQDMKMLDNAETEYRTALIITPYDVEAHYNLGLLYISKKQHDKSIEEFKFVVENTQSPLSPMAKKFIKYLESIKHLSGEAAK